MYSPLSVSREWEVVMNECGVEDYSSVMRWLVVGAVCMNVFYTEAALQANKKASTKVIRALLWHCL